MTDKQIIINNIDVSKCEHLTETRHCKAQMAVMGTDANKCKCFPNCYYKQLKRKEKECEELKEILKEGCLHNLTLMTERRVLLQTLTEIKDYCNKYPQNSIGFKKYILQKINEVLNGTNP